MKDLSLSRRKRTEEIEQYPFSFALKINGHIICERYFPIYNFNPAVIDSLELKELLDTIAGVSNNGILGSMGIIPNYLKNRSYEYLQFFEDNPHLSHKNKDSEKDSLKKKDNYTFEIRIDNEVVSVIHFCGNIFPPKIRYKVNLKHQTNIWGEKILDSNGKSITLDILPSITKEIKKTFSQKSYTKDHIGYSLDYLTKLGIELGYNQ